MGELADLLSKNSPDASPEGPAEDGGGEDYKAMEKASLKAMFDAVKKGDWDTAAEEFGTAVQHCLKYQETEGGGGDAEDTSGHKPGLIIAVGHKR